MKTKRWAVSIRATVLGAGFFPVSGMVRHGSTTLDQDGASTFVSAPRRREAIRRGLEAMERAWLPGSTVRGLKMEEIPSPDPLHQYLVSYLASHPHISCRQYGLLTIQEV